MDVIANNTTTYLPHEIIENEILSRLLVKSLLRFKSVCRQWNDTISDPKFAQTHLRISKNSSSFSCLLGDEMSDCQRSHLITFENDAFPRLSAVDYPSRHCDLFCHCDGLYVVSYLVGRCDKYALWNPSRRSYKELNQYRFDPTKVTCGICYDPLLDDYKVVMADTGHYAIFYCRRNHWSDLKEMCPNFDIRYRYGGAPLKGSVYWVSFSRDKKGYEIVYFDGRDEKWKNLRDVDTDVPINCMKLISSGEGLYLFDYYSPRRKRDEYLSMKKVGDGDEWVVLKGMLPRPIGEYCAVRAICSWGEKIILHYHWEDYEVIYDAREGSIARVELNKIFGFGHIFPYQENLFWY